MKHTLILLLFSCACKSFSQDFILNKLNLNYTDSEFVEGLKKEKIEILRIPHDGTMKTITYKVNKYDSVDAGFYKKKLFIIEYWVNNNRNTFFDFKKYCDKNFKLKGDYTTGYDSLYRITVIGYKYKSYRIKLKIKSYYHANDSTFHIVLINGKNGPKLLR